MNLELDGKVALVTGASRGLGFATALKLAQEGADVAINSRSVDHLLNAKEMIERKTGKKVFTYAGDLTNPEIPKLLMRSVIAEYRHLDILITNAGGPPSGKFEDFDDATWQYAVELSFLSHVRLIREALPYLRKSNGASVLSITSISVKQPMESLILSNSIRLATIGLVKSLALELGKDGIRFNSILPSSTDTERIYDLAMNRSIANSSSIEEEYQKLARGSVLGRIARPEEFANVAAFLVSPAASFVTGVMMPVDGGSYKGTL